MQGTAAIKRQHEREVFLAFVEAAALDVDMATIEAREPPEPDVWCKVGSEPTYFELARLLDQGMQRLRLQMLRSAPNPVQVDPRTIGLPERDVLRKKISKSYATRGLPFELLLYFDAEDFLVEGGIAADDFPTHARHCMQPLLTPMPAHIRRVWVFERYRNSILWCYPGR